MSVARSNIFYKLPSATPNKLTRNLTLGNATLTLPLSRLPGSTGCFLYFKLNDHPALVNEGARLIAEKIKELGIENPFFVTPEASTLALSHVLRDKYSMEGITVYKTKQINDTDPVSVAYNTITSSEPKTLFLDKQKIAATAGKTIMIIDSVCTTGGTVIALYDLLLKAGVQPEAIHSAINLFDEGKVREELQVADKRQLPLYSFAHLHLYDEKGEIQSLEKTENVLEFKK
jgi:adenine phosphoribosyltransferase